MRDSSQSSNVKLDVKRPIIYKLLPMLIFLTVVQQMPILRDDYYSQIRIILYLIFALLSFISMIKLPKLLNHKIFKIHFICIIYVVFMTLVSSILGLTIDKGIIFELLIPFGVLLCSLNIKYRLEDLNKILNIYIFLSLILGISLVYYYGNGFVISDVYFLVGKNAIGTLLGTSCIILIYNLLFTENTTKNVNIIRINKLINILFFIILTASIIVLRNRAGLFALIIVALLMIFKRIKIKITLNGIMIFQLCLILFTILAINGVFDKFIEIIWSSFTMNYDVQDINSISAGRTEGYVESLSYIIEYPLFGELSTVNKFYGTPHNYILNKWVRYGIIGSLPLVIFYLSLWKTALKEVVGSKENLRNSTVALWVLLFSLIVSVFEYTYPFGPGVSQIIVWFLLGQYLNHKQTNFKDNMGGEIY